MVNPLTLIEVLKDPTFQLRSTWLALQLNFSWSIFLMMHSCYEAGPNFIKFYVYVSKLQENLLLVSKLLSNELKAQFNLNECIVKGRDGEVNAIGLRKVDLHETQLSKVHRVYVANLAQSLVKGHARELGHCWLPGGCTMYYV